MIDYLILFPIIFSFLITLTILPYWIRKARQGGLVGKDIHKIKEVEIAEAGGVGVIIGSALGILLYVALNTFVFNSTENFVEIFALMSTLLLISFIAFTDDILGWKIGLRRRTRLFLVAFSSIPLIAINAGKSSVGLPFIGLVDLGILYPLIVIPIGIVGATTTFNFLAGYNGLEAGQGIFLLTGIAAVAYFTGAPWLAIIALCMVASLLAFLFFNFYPARVFPGDSLTYAVGGIVAAIAILGDFEKVAVFFFIPYILEVFFKSRGKLVKQSFGIPKEDGSLDLRYKKFYSLSHVAIALMKRIGIMATEKRVVYILWIFQIIIILIGLIVFKKGIFA